jgi:hypothetical protein
MYQSGQYLHYRALNDDWAERNGWDIVANQTIKPGEQLSIVGATYLITEIFQFLSRLAQAGIYDEGVRVNISLRNTKGRGLSLNDLSRGPLWEEYNTTAEEIPFSEQYSKEALITKPQELALDTIVFFFDRFGWHRPNIEVIKKDQDDLLNRRWF